MGQYDTQITTAVTGVLRRQPTQNELINYNSLLAGTWSVNDLVSFLINSVEAQTIVQPLVRLFRAAYNRAPDGPGLDYWATHLRTVGSIYTAADSFCSPYAVEFVQIYGIDPPHEDFVRAVYSVALERPIDNAGLQFWIGQLEGGMTRGQLVAEFVNSAEMITVQQAAVTAYLTAEGLGQ